MFKKILNYLFKNFSHEQTIVKNSFWIALSRVLSSFFRAILVILSFRILGPEYQGSFYLAMNFLLIFSVIPDFGIVPIFIRELTKGDKEEKYLVANFLVTFFLLFLFSLPLIFLGEKLIVKDLLAKKIIWILVIFVFFDIFRELLYALFRAQEKMEYQAFSFSLTNFLILIFGIFFLLKFKHPYFLALAYLLGGFLGFLFTLFLLNFRVIFNYFKFFEFKNIIKILNQSWAIGIANFIFLLITYIDSLILGYLSTTKAVGIYNSVVKINEFLYFLPLSLAMALFPKITKNLEKKEEIRNILNFGFSLALLLSLPLVFGVFTLSFDFLNFLYGKDYLEADLALKLISLSIPFNFLFLILVDTLIALDKRRELLKFDFLILIINIFLNIIFIPYFSYFASSLITSFSSLLSFLFSFFLVKKYINFSFNLKEIKNYLLASFLMTLLISFLSFHLILKILIGIIFYFFYLWLLEDKILIKILKLPD